MKQSRQRRQRDIEETQDTGDRRHRGEKLINTVKENAVKSSRPALTDPFRSPNRP